MQTLFFHVIQWITTLPYPKTRENKICNKHKIAPQNGHVEIWKNSRGEINNTQWKSLILWAWPHLRGEGQTGGEDYRPLSLGSVSESSSSWYFDKSPSSSSSSSYDVKKTAQLTQTTVIRGLLGSFKSSTKVIDSTFPSCIKPLFKSETKSKTIKVIIMKMIFHSHVKNSFSQARFCSSLILKVKVFGTWKIMAYCKSFEVNISKKVRKEN